ncbi:MAG: hypothetical protein FD164_1441 [Nitrospirae bacterium]|nr:MAG: hypothetical protein FD164_1441 [Nitrospirota bacterium]
MYLSMIGSVFGSLPHFLNKPGGMRFLLSDRRTACFYDDLICAAGAAVRNKKSLKDNP